MKAKILVTFFQIISSYAGGVLTVPWPPLYAKVCKSFGTLNLNVASLASASCAVQTDYFDKLLGMTTGPIALALLIGLYYVVVEIKLAALAADTNGDGKLDWAEVSNRRRV